LASLFTLTKFFINFNNKLLYLKYLYYEYGKEGHFRRIVSAVFCGDSLCSGRFQIMGLFSDGRLDFWDSMVQELSLYSVLLLNI